jgi:hypothetical protein
MRFDAAWSYAGRSGTVADIDVQWTERWARLPPGDLRRVVVRLPIDLDVARLVAEGQPLTSMAVTLSAGGRELLSGRLRLPTFGQRGEPVEGELGDTARDDTGTVPPSSLSAYGESTGSVTLQSWPFAAASTLGASYPYPYGTPGLTLSTFIPATPALVVNTTAGSERLLIAGAPVSALLVYIWGPAWPGAETLSYIACSVETVTDGLGTQVATVDASGFGELGAPAWDSAARYYVSWALGSEALPGRLDRWATWMLGLSTVPVDTAAQASQAAALSRYRLSGYVDDGSSPTSLIAGVCGPLPVGLARTSRGVYLAAFAASFDEAPTESTLVAGVDVHRDGRAKYVEDDPIARVRLRYAWDIAKSTYALQTEASRPGPGRTVEHETPHIYDDGTAQACAMALLGDNWRWVEVAYFADEDRFGWGGPRELRPGQVVRLVDSGLSIDARARVVAIERDRAGMRDTLRLRG